MGLAIVQLTCFALLAAVISAISLPEIKNRNDSINESEQLNRSEDDILAGEDTPVWVARYHPHDGIFYDRVTYQIRTKLSIVVQSLNYWDSLKLKGGFRVRRKPKFDPKNSRGPKNDSIDSLSLIQMGSIVDDRVLHPSVLVVVDYHDVHPDPDRKVKWMMKEKIIYALTFWNTVKRSLRQIRNPRVSLRIAGIVITGMRSASAYLQDNLGRRTLVNALPKMLTYWKKLANTNKDFQIGSYDIVAHMTDIKPQAKCKKCAAPDQKKYPILCSASKGPPCKLPNKIAGILIHDDFAFNGLYLAISRMPKIFGSSASLSVYHRRKWTNQSLDAISTALKNATCMSEPKGRYPPGKPIVPILAGKLLPSVKQCEAAGYKTNAWTCWNTTVKARRTNCRHLYCSDHHNVHDHCSEVGWTLDGTFCDEKNTMICLDGKCVKKESNE